MKYLQLFIIATCLSCVDAIYNEKAIYLIKNETNHLMKIIVFKESIASDVKYIMPRKEFQEIKVIRYSETFTFIGNADSLVVIFDDKKYITQYCKGNLLKTNTIFGDPLSYCIIIKNLATPIDGKLENVNIDRVKKRYTISFDQSDYDRAIDIKK